MDYKPPETKEELAEEIKRAHEAHLFSYVAPTGIMENVIASDAFKGEDFFFYLGIFRTEQLKMDFSIINIADDFTAAYAKSNKLMPEHYDFVLETTPCSFILSDNFTLEEFNHYYYSSALEDDIKQIMLNRVSEL